MPHSLVPPNDRPPIAPTEPAHPEDTAHFRRTLVKVMSMQLVALLALWWLQARYNH
jgi:hypothetical protein